MFDDKKTDVLKGTEKEGEKNESGVKRSHPSLDSVETPKPSTSKPSGEGDDGLKDTRAKSSDEETMEFSPAEPSCQEQLKKLREEVAERSRQIGGIGAQLTESQDEVRRLKEKFEKSEEEKTACLAEAKKALDSLRAENERELTQLREKLDSELTLSNQDAENWHRQYCDLVSQGTFGASGDTGCQKELARLRAEFEKSVSAQEELGRQLRDANMHLVRYQQHLEERDGLLVIAQKALEKKEDELDYATRRIEELGKELDSATPRIEELENEPEPDDEITFKKRRSFNPFRKGGRS